MTKNGTWGVITGLDGSGKTTFKNRLIGYLKEKGMAVKGFKSPHDKHLLSLLDVSGDGLPLVDNYTDQLIFTLDNRLLSYYVRDWKKEFDFLISQRGFLDSFVHGEVRGYSYEQINELQKTEELQKCDFMIHFNADPKVAFHRIKNDPDADKFETLDYIISQAVATENAYHELQTGANPYLKAFEGCTNIYIDTTNLTCDETFSILIKELKQKKLF